MSDAGHVSRAGIMHTFASILGEAGDSAENQAQFVFMIRKAIDYLRRASANVGCTRGILVTSASDIRMRVGNARANFVARMRDPDIDRLLQVPAFKPTR